MAKYLYVYDLHYRCPTCGGSNLYDDFDTAIKQLEEADAYEPEPSGTVLMLPSNAQILTYRWVDGKNRLIATPIGSGEPDTQHTMKIGDNTHGQNT